MSLFKTTALILFLNAELSPFRILMLIELLTKLIEDIFVVVLKMSAAYLKAFMALVLSLQLTTVLVSSTWQYYNSVTGLKTLG